MNRRDNGGSAWDIGAYEIDEIGDQNNFDDSPNPPSGLRIISSN